MTLVNTNILLDLITKDPLWAGWSLGHLDAAALRGPVLINDTIFAELSVRFASIEAADHFVIGTGLQHAAMPRAALFLAGKTFQKYRQAGGTRTGVLPDFFIGAHAAVMGWTLVSRDAQRYRTYFPGMSLITP